MWFIKQINMTGAPPCSERGPGEGSMFDPLYVHQKKCDFGWKYKATFMLQLVLIKRYQKKCGFTVKQLAYDS